MRIMLTTALMLLATVALGDETAAPEARSETQTEAAATQATSETTAAAAEPAPAETTAKAETTEEDKRFRPPAGYRPKRVNGVQMWCTKIVVLGSKFAKEDCRNEAELRELIRTRESMRDDLNQRRPCAGGGCVTN